MGTQGDPELTELEAERGNCQRWLQDLTSGADPSHGDFGDEGKAIEDVGYMEMHRQLLETRLEKIEEHIKLIESGYIRDCDHCSRPISPERLRAVPKTRLCIKCQDDENRKHGRKGFRSFPQQYGRQRTPAYAV